MKENLKTIGKKKTVRKYCEKMKKLPIGVQDFEMVRGTVKYSVYRHNFTQLLQAVCFIKTHFFVQSLVRREKFVCG